ncbi:DUF547 domain-containing protein [Pontibacter diazotrophicus]|uniref:DUF547 domain-containing protein n=1 Tax=Pontibacter diazotrophicus TaxID=1400979 RepID=A0A3D8L8H3_9BACT|nr:DUF547 domain-containing protein [Pontibacter diazotrophicus]RDV13709.1 DUF547 domain-containing protein [Pontibacter diazotrophicus]
MKKNLLYSISILLCCLLITNTPAAQAAMIKTSATVPDDAFYTALSQLLQKHVVEGQVNYRSLQKDKGELQRLVQQIARYNVKGASAAERKAFYMNAYNVLVLQQVLSHYPLKSVMDVPGFFDKQQFNVAGERLTLNELEKQKLLAPYRDARVHFALVCAARSCPPLLNKAYTPAQVEAQLEDQAKRTLQSSTFIKVQDSSKKVLVSEIFKWYEQDFMQEAPSIAAYINRYRQNNLPPGYRLAYYTYNWDLNDSSDR